MSLKPTINEPNHSTDSTHEANLKEVTTNLHKYSLFSILRHLEVNQDSFKPLIGETYSPNQDSIRLYQNPSLSFCYRNIDAVAFKDNQFQIAINEVGLLGTNSPLPSHLLEFIFQRKHQHGDGAWAGFVNMLQHRVLTLFYRSWMNAQSVMSLENKSHDKFSRYLASLAGFAVLDNDKSHQHVERFSKIYFAGYYLQRNRSIDNLQDLLSQYFLTSIRIQENFGQWFKLPKKERTRLGHKSQYTLGDGLVIGKKIYDVQTKFRLIIGPLKLDEFESFFKREFNAYRLMEWLRFYVGDEYNWDVQLILAQEEVPSMVLGVKNRLGLTTWLGTVDRDVDDVVLSY